MDINKRPGEEKQEKQSILADMVKHCDTINALANSLSAEQFDDNIDRGLLLTEIITLQENIDIIKEHIGNM